MTKKQSESDIPKIGRDELETKLEREEPLVLMETLAPEEFERAHLPGAVNVPPDELERLAQQVAPDKDTEVITYCSGESCQASSRAARALRDLGYTNVRHYAGGKQDWTEARLPVERGA